MKTGIRCIVFGVIAIMVVAGACSTPGTKQPVSKEDIKNTKTDIKDAERDANAAYLEEVKKFKEEALKKTRATEEQIAGMRGQSDTLQKGTKWTEEISLLERKNKNLRDRINSYTVESKADWTNFKRDYNHDSDELDHLVRDFEHEHKK